MQQNNFALIVKGLRLQGLNDTDILNAMIKFLDDANKLNVISIANSPTEVKIKKILDEICMSPKSKGYQLWVDAIEMYLNSGKTLKIGEIYNELADKYSKTYCGVSSAMNVSARNAFSQCPQQIGKEVFGASVYYLKGEMLSNKEFLARIANKI